MEKSQTLQWASDRKYVQGEWSYQLRHTGIIVDVIPLSRLPRRGIKPVPRSPASDVVIRAAEAIRVEALKIDDAAATPGLTDDDRRALKRAARRFALEAGRVIDWLSDAPIENPRN